MYHEPVYIRRPIFNACIHVLLLSGKPQVYRIIPKSCVLAYPLVFCEFFGGAAFLWIPL